MERSPGSALGHLAVVRRVWRPALCVFLVCLLNLSLYPALLRLAEPVHEAAAWATYFLPVGVFLAFNLLDFLVVLCSAPSVPQPVVQSRRRPLLGPSPG